MQYHVTKIQQQYIICDSISFEIQKRKDCNPFFFIQICCQFSCGFAGRNRFATASSQARVSTLDSSSWVLQVGSGISHKIADCQWNPVMTSKKKRVSPAGKIGIGQCVAILFLQVPKKCTDDLSLLYILKLGTYSKVTCKNHFPALGVCFPQPCSSAGRRFAASRSRLQNYRRIVSFPQQKFPWNAL